MSNKAMQFKTFQLIQINLKPSRNGSSLYAHLLIDRFPVLIFNDAGDGSEPNIRIINKRIYDEFCLKLETLPELYVEQFGMNFKVDICLFIDLLFEAQMNKTPFKLLN